MTAREVGDTAKDADDLTVHSMPFTLSRLIRIFGTLSGNLPESSAKGISQTAGCLMISDNKHEPNVPGISLTGGISRLVPITKHKSTSGRSFSNWEWNLWETGSWKKVISGCASEREKVIHKRS